MTLAIGRGVKNWSKLPTDSTKKTANMGEGGVKNPEKLPTLFMDGPKHSCSVSRETTVVTVTRGMLWSDKV